MKNIGFSLIQSFLRAPLFYVAFALSLQPLASAGPESFQTWLGLNDIPEDRRAPEDRNGTLNLTNLEAYAFGLNPFTAELSDLPRLVGASESSGLRVLYRLNTGAQDLRLFFKESPEFLDWSRVIPQSEQVVWTENGVEGREVSFDWDGVSQKFVRIEAGLEAESTLVRIEGGELRESGTFSALEVDDFSISKFEVTWGEWLEVREWAIENGYTDLNGASEVCDLTYPVHGMDWYQVVKYCNAKSEMEGLEPVYYDVSVSSPGSVYRFDEFGQCGSLAIDWNMAKNGYRLPTRKEWEYAARGGQSTNNYLFSGSNFIDDVAWHSTNTFEAECDYTATQDGRGARPVGTKAPNELGLYDMTGNLYEWHWDPSINQSSSAVCDVGAAGGRSASGGSFMFPSDPIINFHTSYQPVQTAIWLGFRLARNF